MKWKWVFVWVMLALPASGLLAQSVADDIEQLTLDVQKLSQLKQILTEMKQAYTIINKGYQEPEPGNVFAAQSLPGRAAGGEPGRGILREGGGYHR